MAGECKAASPSQQFEFQPTRGLVHQASDLCITAPRLSYVQATLEPCSLPKKQWLMRANNQLVPTGFNAWLEFFAKRRQKGLDVYKAEIAAVLTAQEKPLPLEKKVKRRCVVHFADSNHLGAAPQFRVCTRGSARLDIRQDFSFRFSVCVIVVGEDVAGDQTQRARPGL